MITTSLLPGYFLVYSPVHVASDPRLGGFAAVPRASNPGSCSPPSLFELAEYVACLTSPRESCLPPVGRKASLYYEPQRRLRAPPGVSHVCPASLPCISRVPLIGFAYATETLGACPNTGQFAAAQSALPSSSPPLGCQQGTCPGQPGADKPTQRERREAQRSSICRRESFAVLPCRSPALCVVNTPRTSACGKGTLTRRCAV